MARLGRAQPKQAYRAAGSKAPAGPQSYTDTLSDALVHTDVASDVRAGAEPLADTLVFTDASAATFYGVRGPSRYLYGAAVQRAKEQARRLPVTAYRSTPPGIRNFAEALSDSLVLTDSALEDLGFGETLADTLVLTDTSGEVRAGTEALSDTVVFTDTRADALAHGETLADTAVFTDTEVDTRTVGVPPKGVYRYGTAAHRAARRQRYVPVAAYRPAPRIPVGYSEALSDALVLTDTALEDWAGIETRADTLVLTDANAASRAGVEALSEAGTFPDASSDRADFDQAPADTVFFTDAESDTYTGVSGTDYSETLATTLTLTTATTDRVAGGHTGTDALVLADNSAEARAGASTHADTLSLLDQALEDLASVETVADLLALADTGTGDWAASELRSDTLTLTDASGHAAAFHETRPDAVVLTDILDETFTGVLGFSYANILEHVRAAIQTATGKTTFISQAMGRPEFPYCVVHLFGHSGQVSNTLARDNVETSFYLQIDGVGRAWTDATWMMSRASNAVRAMDAPPGVATFVVVGRASLTPLESEGLIGVAERLNLRLTREEVPA